MSNSIFCSPTHLKIVVGDADARHIKISDYAEIPLPQGGMINGIITDEGIMMKFFADAAIEYGLTKGDTLLVLDSSNIQSKIMDVPALPEAKLLEFIKSDFSQYSDDVTDDVYDYTVIDPHAAAGGATILAVAVGKPMLQSYMSIITGAGMNLKNIGIGINSQIKLAKFLPQFSEGMLLLAQVDEKQFSLTLFDNSRYLLANRYRLLNGAGTADWVNELGQNLSSMIQFTKSQRTGSEISAVYFAGVNEAELTNIREKLVYLGIDIRMFDMSDRIELSGKAAEKGSFDAGRYILNIGSFLKAR